MNNPIHTKKFQVRAVDIDQSQRIQPVVFMDYLLESASEQAALYGLGVTDLFAKGRTWVLSRFHVEFLHYPAWGENVVIETWPSAKLPLFALRDFEVKDEHGLSARATSSWLIVDLVTRRPIRTAEHLDGFPLLDRRAVPDDFAPLPPPSRDDIAKVFPVFFSDMDINRHVTATVYAHRALETVPEDVLFGFRPTSIEVNFRAEAFYGDSILSRTERIDPAAIGGELENAQPAARTAFRHRLSRASDDKELTLLRTSWAKTD
jgi:medium-chain acyl-[acyl-carrier-protein] hydrolase